MNVEDELLGSLLDFIKKKADAGDDDDESEPRFDVIRFEHVSTHYLMAFVSPHPLMSKTPQKDLVQDAIRYKYGKGDITNKRSKRYWGEKLICIDKDKSVRAYCKEEKKWREVMKSVSWMDDCTSVQTYLDGLIVVGGTKGTEGYKLVSYLDLKAGVVQELPDLPHGVMAPGVVCVGEEVYVMGGYNNSCHPWRLLHKQQWEELPPMIYSIGFQLCTMHNDTIYAIGGSYVDTGKLVQRFNMTTKTWTMKKELPCDCARFNSGFVIHAGKLTVMTADQMMSYDDVTGNWDIIKYNDITAVGYGHGRLVAMEHGGQI